MSWLGLGRHAHPKLWACHPDAVNIEMLALSTKIDDTLLRRLAEEGFFFWRLTKLR